MHRTTKQKHLLGIARGLELATSEKELQALICHLATFIGAKDASSQASQIG